MNKFEKKALAKRAYRILLKYAQGPVQATGDPDQLEEARKYLAQFDPEGRVMYVNNPAVTNQPYYRPPTDVERSQALALNNFNDEIEGLRYKHPYYGGYRQSRYDDKGYGSAPNWGLISRLSDNRDREYSKFPGTIYSVPNMANRNPEEFITPESRIPVEQLVTGKDVSSYPSRNYWDIKKDKGSHTTGNEEPLAGRRQRSPRAQKVKPIY